MSISDSNARTFLYLLISLSVGSFLPSSAHSQVHPRFVKPPVAGDATSISIYVEEADFSSPVVGVYKDAKTPTADGKVTPPACQKDSTEAKDNGDFYCKPNKERADLGGMNYLYLCRLEEDAVPDDCIPPFVANMVAVSDRIELISLSDFEPKKIDETPKKRLAGTAAYRKVFLFKPIKEHDRVLLVQTVYGATTFSEVSTVGPSANPPVASSPAIPAACRIDPGLRTYHFTFVPQGDYAVITYDARSGRMFWSDRVNFYNGLNPAADGPETTELGRTSIFMPVVYVRQKLLVLFCNLHFGSSYAAQSAIVSLPEDSLDLRGSSSTPPANPTSTPTPTIDLDLGDTTLTAAGQTPSLSGSAVALQYSPNDALLAKPSSDPNKYTDILPTESAALFARQIQAYLRGHDATLKELTAENCANKSGNSKSSCSSGSIGQIEDQIADVNKDVEGFRASLTEPGFYANEDAYRKMSGRTSDVVAQLNSLASYLGGSSPGFVKQVQTLSDNYATLHASIQSIEKEITTDMSSDVGACTTQSKPDKATCAPVENMALKQFLADVIAELSRLEKKSGLEAGDETADRKDKNAFLLETFLEDHAPRDLHAQLDTLHDRLAMLNGEASALFEKMNEWYENSSVQDDKPIAALQNVGNIYVNIALREPHAPFTFVSTPPAAPTTGAMLASSSPTKPSHATLLIEVHRQIFVNAVAGALVIAVPNRTYAALPCSQVAGADATKTTCVGVTSSAGKQIEAMLGVTYTPWGRDYYPFGSRGAANDYGWRRWLPSFILGASVTSIGNGFGGVDFEGFRGVDIYAGAANASSSRLPSGLKIGSTLDPATTLTTGTAQKVGVAFGAGFDLSIFCGIFKSSCGS